MTVGKKSGLLKGWEDILPALASGGEGTMMDEVTSTRLDVCCICGEKRLSPDLVFEERPSGDSGCSQEWPYCLACWFNMSQLRKQELHLDKLFDELEI